MTISHEGRLQLEAAFNAIGSVRPMAGHGRSGTTRSYTTHLHERQMSVSLSRGAEKAQPICVVGYLLTIQISTRTKVSLSSLTPT